MLDAQARWQREENQTEERSSMKDLSEDPPHRRAAAREIEQLRQEVTMLRQEYAADTVRLRR